MIKTIGIELGVIIVHLLFVKLNLLPGDFEHMLKIDIFLIVIFTFGLLIVYPGLKKGAENFSLRFLIMTTMQLLLMLSLILVLTFTKVSQVKVLGFTAISIFVILLAIQSVVLIKRMNK